MKGAITLVLLALPFIVFSSQLLEFLSRYGGALIDRILLATNTGDQGRSSLWHKGLEQFANHPIFGNSFVLDRTAGSWVGFYPHNIIVESLIALGIIGGILILCIIGKGIFVAYKEIVQNSVNGWLGILFLQFSILAMFSNAIYTNHFFWYYSVLVIAGKYNNNEKFNEAEVPLH